MTTYSTGARNKIVDSIGANGGADWFSLHSLDPGATGANEVAGAPRKNGGYPAAAAGEAISVGTLHDVPATTTIRFYGRWTAATGGTFLLGGPLPADEVFGVAGQYQLSNKIQQPAN